MKIKNFKIEQYDEVYEIWKRTGLSLGASDTREQVERISSLNSGLFLVGIKKNEVVAVVMGAFDGRRGYVHHLAVKPEYQRKGYGKMMMDELHSRFLKTNIKKVHLFIERDNEGVINFYKKIGWHVRDDLEMMSYVPKYKERE